MRFDAERLARLAGIDNNSESGIISEAQNRSYHEDPSIPDSESEYINQLNETEATEEDLKELFGDIDEDDLELELNESDLRNEIIRMKKLRSQKQRANGQSLQERNLRSTIRKEIRNVLNDIDLNNTGEWVYGDNKPKRSKKGYVSIGARGIGFR